MKQTAVEWLVDMLIDNKYLLKDAEHLFNQAKELEKQQIIDDFNYGVYDGGGLIKKYKMSGEIYYNETFKSE